ncbi:MAG: hypothetical protein IPG56_07575 [Caulobacteraceae bacterium]|nr:hypothetical protein [Caulobacteraceae bacterium]
MFVFHNFCGGGGVLWGGGGGLGTSFTGYWSSDPPMTLVGLAGMVVAGVCAFTGVLTLLFGGLAALLSLFMSRRSEEQRR